MLVKDAVETGVKLQAGKVFEKGEECQTNKKTEEEEMVNYDRETRINSPFG